MSEVIFQNGTYSVTLFWGGQDRGQCLQITSLKGENFIQLTAAEAMQLAVLLAVHSLQALKREVSQYEP